MDLSYKKINSPVGKLTLIANDNALTAILWENESNHHLKQKAMIKNEEHPILKKTEKELAEYFKGERTTFTIPIEMNGTEFQKTVWSILLTIPFGKTQSYYEVAEKIGKSKAVRAVGGAVGRNPISIIIPCHRVIGTNGTLTGFAGGIHTKAILLQLENPSNRFD